MAKVFNKIWKAPVKKEKYLEKLKSILFHPTSL